MKFKREANNALAAILIATASLTGGANAAIVFSTEGGTGHLLVTITEDIPFTFTGTATSEFYYNLTFEDAYSSNQSTNWGNLPTVSSSVLTLNNPTPTVNDEVRDGGILNSGQLDLNDLAMLYRFTTPQSVTAGQTAVVSTGTFSFGKVLPVPDNSTFTAHLGRGGNQAQITNSVPLSSIPEPSSALLLGLGSVALLSRRRRNA